MAPPFLVFNYFCLFRFGNNNHSRGVSRIGIVQHI